MAHWDIFSMQISGGFVMWVRQIAWKPTGQGFKCNMTIKGPHRHSDVDTSIFRGLSHVPAFFRNLGCHLTLKVMSLSTGVFVWDVSMCMYVNVYACWWGKRDREKERKERETIISQIEFRQPSDFLLEGCAFSVWVSPFHILFISKCSE